MIDQLDVAVVWGRLAAIAEEIQREVAYRDVETNGAARAAQRIADLL